MSATLDQIDDFRNFALARVAAGDSQVSIEELFEQWRSEHVSVDDLKAIKASLLDFERGERGMTLEQFRVEFRKTFPERHST